MKNLKSTVLTMFLVMGMAGALLAGDRYDFATVKYIPSDKVIQVSMCGGPFEEFKVTKEQQKNDNDMTIVMNYLKKLSTEGWELVTVAITQGSNYNYILKKQLKY